MTDATAPAPLTEFPIDPRVQPVVDALTDAQVADVLRQMNDAWTPDDDLDFLLSTPAGNRATVIETFVLNIGMGGALEFAPLERFAAAARLACPA